MPVTLADLDLVCTDCNDPFTFSIPEQAFYADRASKRPDKCPQCRASRRAERYSEAIKACESETSTPGSEQFGNFLGFTSGSNGGGARRGSRPVGSPMKFSTVCSACGKSTEVPFEPRNGRPVYCRACFNARRAK